MSVIREGWYVREAGRRALEVWMDAVRVSGRSGKCSTTRSQI